MEFFVSLVAGAIGGNIAGGVFKKYNLGLTANTVAGLIGGGTVTLLLDLDGAGALGQLASNADPQAVLMAMIAGAAGGGALSTLVGLLRDIASRR
ncbi:hypothetical protein [Oceanomicrobium pacificus]|uniref:Uncharacterized protein n=1 Tax=Oceanomicrobium pacificus TaxID=2692916 RepID=A0A6B0TSI2_9RHOB|nr:hypothetical protein [Oceanomicrobium pacificus]MXU64162.1 hypothetical protein [Oceanomicrobium pacificus]